jgi:hypothetical protein
MVNLAAACHTEISPPAQHEAIKSRRASVRTHEEAKAYLKDVEAKIREHRKKRTH